MALQPFLRLTLDEYLRSAVAGFPLRHGFIKDRLAISDRFDQYATGRHTLADNFVRNGICPRL